MFFVWVKTLLKRSNANIRSCFHISSRTTEKIAFFIFYYLVCFKICGNVGDKINIYHKDYALNNWRKRWVSEAYMHSPKHSLKQDVLQLIPWGISWGIPHFLSPVPPIPYSGFYTSKTKANNDGNIKACVRYFLIFHQKNVFKKLWKMLFISSNELFSFSKYSSFCNFLPFFPYFPDSKGQMKLK